MIAAGRGGLGGGCQSKVAPPNVPGVETKTARLLLRQQLHLNLNLNVQETLRDGVDIDDVDEDVGDDEEEATNTTTNTTSEQLSIVATGDNLQTVTTVPQTNEQLKAKVTTTTAASSSSSSAAGGAAASSALAKFNRIIDSTMERPQATSAMAVATLPQLSSATLQQRFNLAYPELVTQQQQQHQPHQLHDAGKQNNSSLKGNQRLDRGSGAVASTPLTFQAHKSLATAKENEQVARREEDPHGHHPLDETAGEDYGPNDDDHPHHDEDNQMKRNDVHYLLKQLNSFSDIEEIEIVDMKQREQQQQQQQRQRQRQGQGQGSEQTRPMPMASSSLVTMVLPNSPTPASPSTQSHKLGVSSLLLPQHQPQFDDYLFESCHYLETNYFAATYRTAMVESSSHEFRPSTNSSSNSFELHEMEPPSVICKAAPPPPPPAAPPEYRQYSVETRLTTSGVQTELTAESLAKLSNSTSSSSTRAPPFFRCCYTPIDRWREKRQQKSSSTPESGTAPPKNV